MNNTTASFLPVRRWIFQIRMVDTLQLPLYAGSMLRGAFGHALRRIACVTRQPTCADCPLRPTCAYSYLFETPVSPEMAVLRRYPAAPHPLVIEAPWGPRRVAAGETLEFAMVVIGRALHSLPLIVLAWQRACADGLGGNRAVAELLGYREEGESDWRVPAAAATPSHTIAAIPAMPDTPIVLRFVSPFRARKDGRLCAPRDLRFREVLSHLQRRVGLLHAFHGSGSWTWDYEHALRQAEQIAWEPLDARWMDWSRYSSRQKQSMQLGGILGAFRLPGQALAPLWPLLYLGQWTHVGKNASFGLGQYLLSTE